MRIAPRWAALAIIFLSFVPFTLNWFAIVPAFGAIAGELRLGLPQIGALVSAFMAGYGLGHIPGGLLASRWGVRAGLLLGMALLTLGAVLGAASPGYATLLLARLLCGLGGSVYIGSAIGLTGAWFRERELVMAMGLVTGVAFMLGAAAGLYGWASVVAALGWRAALLVAAAAGLASLLLLLLRFPTPQGPAAQDIRGGHLDLPALRRVFANRALWLLGASFLGAYGSYFTAAQLLPGYAARALHVSAGTAGLLGAILLLSGIPGAFLGGWLADCGKRPAAVYLVSCAIAGCAVLAIPMLGTAGLECAALALGLFATTGFVVWIALPARAAARLRLSDIPAAAGLLLSIAAIGGVLFPWLYAHVASAWGADTAWRIEGGLALLLAPLAFAARA